MESSSERKSDGQVFNASATEVDTVRHLSEYCDSSGFVREQMPDTKGFVLGEVQDPSV